MITAPQIDRKRAFTLIELLAVMGIMALMMTMTVTAFYDFSKTAAIRGSLWNVKSSLDHARQFAITQRMRTTWFWTNVTDPEEMGCYMITTNESAPYSGFVTETNYLAGGILFSNDAANMITFDIDGSAQGVARLYIGLRETRTNGQGRVVMLYPLTGITKIE